VKSWINDFGYVTRIVGTRASKGKGGLAVSRDWFFPKYDFHGAMCLINLSVSVPRKYAGQHIKFRVEVYDTKGRRKTDDLGRKTK